MAQRKTNNVYFFGEAKHMVNGQIVEDKALQTTYDGKVLHVDKRINNDISHFTVKDKVLGKLLTTPTSGTDLIERLKRDFTKGQHVKHRSVRRQSVRRPRQSVRRQSVRRQSVRRQSVRRNKRQSVKHK